MLGLAAVLERSMIRVCEVVAWLALAVVLTLFGQLPVRELIHRGHLALNDFGQLFHATVFLVGIPYALLTDAHVRLDLFHRNFSPRTRALVEVFGTALFVVPWVALLALHGEGHVLRSVSLRETFPETLTPGYFLMRVSFALFVMLMIGASVSRVVRALHEAFRPRATT